MICPQCKKRWAPQVDQKDFPNEVEATKEENRLFLSNELELCEDCLDFLETF